ncbi:hypothetical protein, partial [Escherichia fergusonii]|uniref:hypothetical protein n=1 Tax=Escherichia fergusonii TaxID=564 RepID=UPI001CBFA516
MITKYVALAYKSRICLFEGTFRKYHGGTGGLTNTIASTADAWLQQAADAADKVMTEGGFKLNTANGT